MTATAAAAAPAAAVRPAVSLKSDVKVERSVTTEGLTKTVLSDPKDVVPGDRLRFTTYYRNDGKAPVANFVVTNPLPKAVALAADDAFVVSVDGGKTFGKLASLKVADARLGSRAAMLADVTHLRWVIPAIAPGSSGSVTYFAIVR
ncbi:MAG: hypothetical protein ACKOPO_00165 [Novosphingobium sp.]